MAKRCQVTLSLLMLLVGLGSASGSRQEVTQPVPHSHRYAFTEVLGDYHVRLIVNHVDGEMALVFEDIAERPVKPVELDSIKGKVIFPDGTVKEEKFRPRKIPGKRYYTHKYGSKSKKRGIFIVRGKWIRESPAFRLEVTVSFKGKDYEPSFEYEALGGKIPYHRG